MKLDYTEFSFGFPFTENLLRGARWPIHSAAVFPNLLQEASVGYDVRIDRPAAPLFFQFKLPELITRKSHRGVQAKIEDLSIPYFIFQIMPRSRSQQHNLLVAIERRMPGSVFYASPRQEFKSLFDICYIEGCVSFCSAWISPAEIGPLMDDDPHSIVYEPDARFSWFCSEPREVRLHDPFEWAQRLPTLFETRYKSPLRELVRRMLDTLADQYPPPGHASERIREAVRVRLRRLDVPSLQDSAIRAVVEALLVCREIARIGLGLELLIAQPRGPRVIRKGETARIKR